jgi:dephospho-CoA kinase
MPFPDEPFAQWVDVLPYRERWAAEGSALLEQLRILMPGADAIDHIGSTSVPGLPEKDCLDAMVQVTNLGQADFSRLSAAGFRERPEPWSRCETLDGTSYAKRVFAPPVDGRPVNIHIREVGSATARYALLFRDYLRADDNSRDVWGQFKTRLAESATDIYDYGGDKSGAQPLLMASPSIGPSRLTGTPDATVSYHPLVP